MTHMVIVHMASETSYHPCADLATAVQAIERFRNEDGVDSLELFELNPVNFEFKTYYQVEIGGHQASSAASMVTPMADATNDAPVSEIAPVIDFANIPSEQYAPVDPAIAAAASVAAFSPADNDFTAAESFAPDDTFTAAPADTFTPAPADTFTAAEETFGSTVSPPPPPPPAPHEMVPPPPEAAAPEASPMFAAPFESEAFPAAPAAEGFDQGFELNDQLDSPFGEAAPSSAFLSTDLPPLPAPPDEGILAEMAEIADKASDAKPRKGLFGR